MLFSTLKQCSIISTVSSHSAVFCTDTRASLCILLFCGARQPPVGQGLLIREVSRSHSDTHTRQESSGRVMSSSQRPLPDNTQHSQQRDTMPPVGFEPAISTGKRPQTYALDRAAPGIGCVNIRCMKNGASFKCSKCNIELSRNSRVNVIVIPNNIKRCEHKSFLLGISRTPYISTETVKLL